MSGTVINTRRGSYLLPDEAIEQLKRAIHPTEADGIFEDLASDVPSYDRCEVCGGSVLEDSLVQAGRLGKTTALIGELPDADTPEDLAALLAHPLAASLAQRESLRFLRNLVK